MTTLIVIICITILLYIFLKNVGAYGRQIVEMLELVHQWRVRFPPSTLPPVEMGTTYSTVIQMQKATFTGNIINVKVVDGVKDKYDTFLAVTVACEDSKKNSIRIRYTDNNGMLKATQNGEDLTGIRVVVHGDIDLTGIRSHYTQDGVNKTLKHPEISLNYAYTERVSTKPAQVAPPKLSETELEELRAEIEAEEAEEQAELEAAK